MHKYRTSGKIKISQIYHNYSISTKCFDGTTLYDMFLANQRANRGKDGDDAHKTAQSQNQSQANSNHKPLLEVAAYRPKKITIGVQGSTEPTLNTDSRKQIYRRGCHSGNNFYTKIYESLEVKKNQHASRIRVFSSIDKKKKYEDFNVGLRARSMASKKKVLQHVNEYFPKEAFSTDLLIGGKLGGFTASAITIISDGIKIYDCQGDKPRQIASLTKIMTCIVSIYLAQKLGIQVEKEEVRVSRKAGSIEGTSAELKNGDVLTVIDLLYGMMLPSGNDAAYALAEYFSKKLNNQEKSSPQKKGDSAHQVYLLRTMELSRAGSRSSKNLVNMPTEFIEEMNNLSRHLGMSQSHFNNPHGLSDQENISTSNDIAKLCHYAMKNQLFKKIVATKEYEANIFSVHQKMKRRVKWTNTNKLLNLEHCLGIKTGITPAAGPCMSAYFTGCGFIAIIIVLNTKSKNCRFQEVQKLFEWVQREMGKKGISTKANLNPQINNFIQ